MSKKEVSVVDKQYESDVSLLVDQLNSVRIEEDDSLSDKSSLKPSSKNTITTNRTPTADPSKDISVTVKHISYAAWLIPPPFLFASENITSEEIFSILSENLHINANARDISQLIVKSKLTSNMRIVPFQDIKGPESKPNLLCAISAILYNHLLATSSNTTILSSSDSLSSETSKLLQDSLYSQFDIICPRNPLKKLMTTSCDEEWELFACRPAIGSPLMLERTEGYDSNHGSIGMQFEKLMVSSSIRSYNRVYTVNKLICGSSIRIGLTGEIDGVDSQGNPIEIKSKPFWVQSSYDRNLATAVQSKLGNVETIVTGGFSAQKGVKNGPVMFELRNIVYQSLNDFCNRNVQSGSLNASFQYTNYVLQYLMDNCTEVGVIYHIKSPGAIRSTNSSNYLPKTTFTKKSPSSASMKTSPDSASVKCSSDDKGMDTGVSSLFPSPNIRINESSEFKFPVSESTLINCAQAIIQYHNIPKTAAGSGNR